MVVPRCINHFLSQMFSCRLKKTFAGELSIYCLFKQLLLLSLSSGTIAHWAWMNWDNTKLHILSVKSTLFGFPSSQIPPRRRGRTSRRPISATRLTSAAWWTSTLPTRPWTKVRSALLLHSRLINNITVPLKNNKKKQKQKKIKHRDFLLSALK